MLFDTFHDIRQPLFGSAGTTQTLDFVKVMHACCGAPPHYY